VPGEPVAPAELAGPDEEEQGLSPEGRGAARRVFWLAAAALVICVALAAGTGLFRGRGVHQSLYQRTMEIAGQYRCPVCAGESAAASDAPAAVEIRHLVGKWLEEGRSPAQIRSYLVADYGPSILEKPPASGLDVLVWVLPALAVALGAAGLALAFVRWRRAEMMTAAALPPGGVEAPVVSPAGLSASLGTSHDPRAGEGAAVQVALFELAAEPAGEGPTKPTKTVPVPARRPRPWYQRLMVPAGVGLMVLGAVLWVVDRSSPELPGGTITGGTTGLNVELGEAQALMGKDPAKALAIYGQILASNPDQPIALTAEGWIFAEAGFASRAMPLLTKAEKVDPSYGPAHLYRGLVLLEYEKAPSAAAAELEWYLGHDPSPSLVKVAEQALADARAGDAKSH
jgi:cytochrome c-type biogenesis protein CcmH